MVNFRKDGCHHSKGPEASHYDREHKCSGFHMFFNAFCHDDSGMSRSGPWAGPVTPEVQ